MKNCDRGLENAARGRSFFTLDPKPNSNNFIFFSCCKLAYKRVCLRNFVVFIRLRAIHKLFARILTSVQANEQVTQILDKGRFVQ